MKISKLLIPMMCMLLAAADVYAKDYLNNGKMHDINDFEIYNTGIISYRGTDKSRYVEENSEIKCEEFGKITNSWALESSQGEMVSAVDETIGRDGSATKALHFYVDGTSNSADYHLIFQPNNSEQPWNDKTAGKYYVYKFDFKSGGDGDGYFKGNNLNLDERYTIDWSTGRFSVNGGGVTLISGETGMQAFALDEWVTFTMIIDRTGERDVHYIRFESSLGKNEYKIQTNFNKDNYKIENSNPRFLIGNGWICGGSSKPDNPSLYIDNVEMYVTDYNILLRNAGQSTVEVSDKILLDVSGDINEQSLGTIAVSENGENVVVKSIEYADGLCTITLDEKMKEFTEYTVDFSNVEGELGVRKGFSPQSFTTFGRVELLGDVKLSRILFNSVVSTDRLGKGLIQAEFTVINKTAVDIDGGIIEARLISNGKTEALCYKRLCVAAGQNTRLICAFTVSDEAAVIELCSKNSLGGGLYYTDIYTVGKNGIMRAAAENTDEEKAGVDIADTLTDAVKFYNLTIDENAGRAETDKLLSGITECAAEISSPGAVTLICALKHEKNLKFCVYAERENASDKIYAAVSVPDDGKYTIDAFVWDSIAGANGYIRKTTISSASEEN